MFGNDKVLFRFRGPWGVPVEVHSSLLILVLLLIAIGGGGSLNDLYYDLMFISILLGSIYLHELGHAWGCLVQGVPVRRVVLYGGGGYCQQARSSTRYQTELIVAMGPIVNLTLWAVASLLWPVMGDGDLSWALYLTAYVNLFLALLNLLPVHPLDGGKLFELALMRVLPPQTATRVSGGVGLVISVLWIPAMLLCFLTIGLALFFIPSVRLHLDMLRGTRGQRRA